MVSTPYGPGELLRFNFAGNNGCYVRVRLTDGMELWVNSWEVSWK